MEVKLNREFREVNRMEKILMSDLSEQQKEDASHCCFDAVKSYSKCDKCSCLVEKDDCVMNYIMDVDEVKKRDWKYFKSFLSYVPNHFNNMKTWSDKDKMQETVLAIEKEIARLRNGGIVQ